MKAYRCRVCGNPLYFENSVCVSCGTPLGYSRGEREIVPVDASGVYVDADGWIWHVCRNLNLSGCTWLAPLAGGQCFSCDLTRIRPADTDAPGLVNFPIAERAKRHLITELDALGFPLVTKGEDPTGGLAFDLLSSTLAPVMIAHSDGIITIDLAESDDSHRERIRRQLDEPYRTMLGHFRHEVGHYFQWRLVEDDPEVLARCRELFGDESVDYDAEIRRHYADGPPANWTEHYISSYATMHPYEDFAETWAHYLHICDTLETAIEYGLLPAADLLGHARFRDLVASVWVKLSTGLNLVNRSMGKDDLYPFVLAPTVLDKLDFVSTLRPAP
ncbi:zinc-binding metallopeptidase family protein [Microbacterium memoriense]|uniref:Zinc-binding peptidase n=1 Tax=Microbacterium memoriense TaxID=2978350 RepID=A0ABT2PCI2_9MICO|nr:putative zinc-binding metallopeptidase [Microbacterium memoriense]MCT9001718.1 putative zinc-binding peptidase [Microbacterium memoriense]